MPIHLRVIPEWTDFAPRLVKAIQQREQQSDGFNQTDKEETLLTNVHPNIQFHYSCAPLHRFHCITSYSGCSVNVVLGFKWGQTELDHQIVTWVDDGQGNLRLHSTVPVYGRYKIELMFFIPSRGMLVGYCNDMWLRILTDKTQEMVVLFQSKCPFLVASMHYCPETSLLLTGSMGLIAFWDLNPSTQNPLSLLRTLDWTTSSLRRDAVITAFVPQCQTNSFYALCSRHVKSFENTGEKEQFEFRGQSFATLRCAVTEWRQRYLYTGDAEGYMQVWSYDTRRLFLQFRAHVNAVTSLVLLSESGTILSASTGCWIKQWTRTGDLLLKLHTDMPGGVRSMWKLGKNVLLCQSSNSLDVWHLNSAYRSFNDTSCTVRVLQRLDCGGGKARILAVTQEGIMRFFSPVSGELLFLSWPFLHIDKALGFAYDPIREELYICDGSVDVLVLNTTLNPCPVKHIINTVKDGYDGVMCLASVLLRRLQDRAGHGSPLCLVFSGHCNGKLQLLAPLGLTCRPKQAHIGAICQMTSSNAGETPLICCFGTDNEFTLWSVSFGEHHVNLILHHRITCNFTPVHCRVLKGFICAISPEQNLVLYSLNGEKKPTVFERKQSERISCLDYCPQLDIIAVSGESGKVEIWNSRGDLVAEIQLGVPVTQVCFGNTRGDILASFSDGINIMSVTHILPPSYLRSVLRQAPADEIIEVPIPFVPKSPSHYDISLVAKMYLKHDETEGVATKTHADPSTHDNGAEDSTLPTEVSKHVARKSVVRPFTFRPQTQPAQSSPTAVSEEEPGQLDGLEVSGEALTRAETLQDTFLSFFRPIASGGYIPNSVVKDIHNMEQLAKKKGRLEMMEKMKKMEKIKSLLRYCDKIAMTCPSEHAEHSKNNEEILTRSKRTGMQDSLEQMAVDDPEKLIEMFLTMLEDLDTASEEEYKKITIKLFLLLRLMEEHGYAEDIVDALRQKLLAYIMDSSVQWRQLESLRNLRTLGPLRRDDICMVASLLVNPYGDLRTLALLISNADFNVFDKQGLRKKLRPFTSHKEVEALLAKLSDDLHLLIEHYNIVATSSSITHTETSKTTVSGLVDAEINMPSTTAMTESTEVQDKNLQKKGTKFDVVLRKREVHTEDKKHTQMLTTEVTRSSRMIHPVTPKSRGGKTIPAGQDHTANWRGMAADKSSSSADRPLLYAFRQACMLESDMFPLWESRLQPDDLGFMSTNQEASRQLPAAGKKGTLMPIGKPKPKKVFAKADKLTSRHTSHLPQSSSQHSHSHLDPAQQQDDISQSHADITLKDSRNTDHHYDMASRQPHTDHHFDMTSQQSHTDHKYDDEHPSDATSHFDLTKQQHSRDPTSHYDLTKQHPRNSTHLHDPINQQLHDPTLHYDVNKQHPRDLTLHYDFNKQHPRDPTHHYDLTKQHHQDGSRYYDLTKQHHQDSSRYYDLINQLPHGNQHHYDVNSQPSPWSYDDSYGISSQLWQQLHRLRGEHHHDFPSQHRFNTEHHYDITSQHRYNTEHHYDIPFQQSHSTVHPYDNINSQHSHEPSQKGNPTLPQLKKDTLHSDTIHSRPPSSAAGPWNRDQYPRGPLRPPGDVGQHPQRTTQHHPTLLPYNDLQAADQPLEQGKGREQGDLHWRESLHKLISLHGFRSHKAARAVASLCAQPLQAQTRVKKTILPPLRYSRHCAGAPGERVLRQVQLTEGGGTSTSVPLRFQNEIPVPWRLSHFPLRPQGQVRYGKLKMDWVRSELENRETERLTLPKIDLKQRSLFQG